MKISILPHDTRIEGGVAHWIPRPVLFRCIHAGRGSFSELKQESRTFLPEVLSYNFLQHNTDDSKC
jgi:hypothetical protein